MRTISIDTIKQSGQETTVQGWVASRRDHGGLIFIDLRDHKGIVQLTITPDSPEMFKIAEGLRDEYVIEATGMVKDRAEDLKNPNIATGGVEIVVSNIRILNKSDALPFQVNTTQNVSEEHRLRYRYLDLRGDKMQARLKQRSEFNKYIRRYMEDLEFTEVATPVLANSSPEGARDFVIPSRHHPGQFYALPQAPQQFKQLLMVGGVDRYYQFATCFRDEDPRADRLYGDFYQLDLEMAFTEQGSVVLDTMEPLIKNLVTDFGGKQLLSDDVPRMTFEHAMETYGTDKPDLRFGMELIDLTEELTGCGFGVFSGAIEKGGAVKAILVKDGAKFSRSYIDKLTDIAKSAGAGGLPYIKFTDAYKNENNGEVSLVQSSEDAKVFGGPISKFFTSDELLSVFKKVDFNPYTDIILFGSDSRAKVNKVLGSLRSHLGDVLELKDPNVVALCWVIDF
ncbi:MAG: aspartyl-tRNA synthetase, partial [Candidatus Saccharimonadales bacterium]